MRSPIFVGSPFRKENVNELTAYNLGCFGGAETRAHSIQKQEGLRKQGSLLDKIPALGEALIDGEMDR